MTPTRIVEIAIRMEAYQTRANKIHWPKASLVLSLRRRAGTSNFDRNRCGRGRIACKEATSRKTDESFARTKYLVNVSVAMGTGKTRAIN